MQAKAKATTTAQVIDFRAAKRAIKRQQSRAAAGHSATRAIAGTDRPLTAAMRQRLDEVRSAAKARL